MEDKALENKMRQISPGQLVMLLFLSKLFTLLTMVPRRGGVTGSAGLLASCLSAVIVGVALLPVVWLFQKTKEGVFPAADSALKPLGTVLAVFMGLFCMVIAAYTVTHFSLFMVSTVYFNGHTYVFLFCLILVATYAASLGLEPLARMSLSAFLLVLITGVVFILALWGDLKWQNVISPFYEGLEPILASAGRGAAQFAEPVLLLLLLPRVKEPGKMAGTICRRWLILTICGVLIFGLLVLTALGEYGGTRLFPIHTLSTVAHFSIGGRMDLLYLCLWIFVAFLRASLWIYGGAVCLGRLFPKESRMASLGKRALAAGVGSAALSLALLPGMKEALPGMGGLSMGIPLVVLAVGMPLLLLLSPLAREGKKKGGKAQL